MIHVYVWGGDVSIYKYAYINVCMLSARAIHLTCWWLAKIRDQYQEFMPRSFRYALEMSITENDKAIQYAGAAADNMGVICQTQFDPSIDYKFVGHDGTLVSRAFAESPASIVAPSAAASSATAPSGAAPSVAPASVEAPAPAPSGAVLLVAKASLASSVPASVAEPSVPASVAAPSVEAPASGAS